MQCETKETVTFDNFLVYCVFLIYYMPTEITLVKAQLG